MTRDDVLDLYSSLRGAVEDYPFGDEVAVFKVAGKMFALVSLLGEPGSVNLKCDPDLALELRATHDAFRPGYHQNKRHWNTVELDGTIEDTELRAAVAALAVTAATPSPANAPGVGYKPGSCNIGDELGR